MTARTRVSAAPAALERTLPLLEPSARPDEPDAVTRSGYLDLLGGDEPDSTGIAKNLMLTGVVPTVYERWWRPALGRVAKGLLGPGMADEHRIARLLLGLTPGDGVLDVACGPGNFTRRFAHLAGQTGLAVGIDASPTMLERAVRDSPDPSGTSSTCAATRSNCPSATAASTPCAASPPCTCSRTRLRVSTRCDAFSRRAAGSR